MATRTWAGGSGLWTDRTQWVAGAAPVADDVVVATAGTVDATGASLGAQTIYIGAGAAATAMTLRLSGSRFGKRVTLGATKPGSFARIDAQGVNLFGGTISADSIVGQLAIAVSDQGETPGALVLLGGSLLYAAGGDPVSISGHVSSAGSIVLGRGATMLDSGRLSLVGGAMQIAQSATLAGGGTVELGLGATLDLQAGAAATSQAIRFTDVGAVLKLADPAALAGAITGFRVGDVIDLAGTVATSAFYNGLAGTLTVQRDGATIATLRMSGPAFTAMTVMGDGAGGTLLQLPGTQDQTSYRLAADDRAMRADVARTLTTPGGAPITGAGVKIGIISNSFDIGHVADAAAQAGYLPRDAASGGSAVHVLFEGNPGDSNEGLAMAELAHQVAPGAELYFASGDGGLDSFAEAVTALRAAGCQVIVDDLTYNAEPFFQLAGTLDSAIDEAVGAGVNYFTAAGNDGGAAYQSIYNPQDATLPDGSQGIAQRFDNGAASQTITLAAGLSVTLLLQWAAPWETSGPGAEQQLSASLYDAKGVLRASSAPLDDGSGTLQPEQVLTLDVPVTAQYRLVLQGALPAGTTFKYVLLATTGGAGSTLPGTIDDPPANTGTIKGHALLPGVNTVGAVDYAITPAFGSPASATTYYSATGPSDLLFDESGQALSTPRTVAGPSFVAPTGAGTSVKGFAPFNGTSAAAPNAAAVAALMLQANPNLTPAQVTYILQATSTDLDLPESQQGGGLIDAERAVRWALDAACFAQGTRIATPGGAVPVESLRAGDLVRTLSGAARPVRWVGHRRVDCQRHPKPEQVWPIRVQAHAFAPGQPARALHLSPDHAVWVGGTLIPIRYLANGASIAQAPRPAVTYFHVELDTHDVLLAEGLPAESFLDTGNRGAFENGGAPLRLHPDFARAAWSARACAPLAVEGPEVARAHARLRERALELGHAVGRDPGLAVWSGGRRLATTTLDGRWHAHLPAGARRARLRSRAWSPAEHGEADARRLGVALAALALDGAPIPPTRFVDGWHAAEPEWRWTDGDAGLDVSGCATLSFDLALAGRYWNTRPTATTGPGRWARAATAI